MAGGRALVKLFGKTIPLAPPPGSKDFPVPVDDGGGGGTENGEEEIGEELADRAAERGDDGSGTEGEMRNGEEGSEAPLGKKGLKAAEEEEDGDGTKGPPEPEKTTLPAKKPEKIIPCPRCSSMATKFCYYNNYNVNQPRHFCKNCQRYWTAGGSMRNVPVGAGRRKSKHGAAAAAAAQPTVLRFGPDDPLRDTESLAEKKPPPPATAAVSCSPNSSGFSTEDRCASNLQNKPILRGPPSFTWSAPGAMKFYPTAGAFWGWASPWPAAPPPVKRFREETLRHSTREENSSCRLWIPKTLRIDHPEEAVKSSIWAMAGGIFDRARKEGMGSSAALPHANPAALSRSLSFRESA